MGDKEDVSITENATVVDSGNERKQRTGFLRNLQQNARDTGFNQQETTGTGSGDTERKRGPGRPRKPRDEHGNIIRNDGTANAGNASGATGTGDANGTGDNRNGTAAGEASETISVGEEGESVKPKRKYTPRKKKSNTVQASHVEALTVQVFALTAMLKQSPHWMVQDPKKEIEPWSGAAAELINEYMPKETVEKAIGLNAGVAVAVGIGMMVFQRMQIDAQLKSQRIAAQRQTQPAPKHPQEVRKSQPEPPKNPTPMRQRSTPAGGGAAPTRPVEPLDGLNVETAGLS